MCINGTFSAIAKKIPPEGDIFVSVVEDWIGRDTKTGRKDVNVELLRMMYSEKKASELMNSPNPMEGLEMLSAKYENACMTLWGPKLVPNSLELVFEKQSIMAPIKNFKDGSAIIDWMFQNWCKSFPEREWSRVSVEPTELMLNINL
jgi:hypothetical protein